MYVRGSKRYVRGMYENFKRYLRGREEIGDGCDRSGIGAVAPATEGMRRLLAILF